MHTPLDIMRIRTAELDEQGNCDLMSYRDSLKKTASPLGGAFGRVRSSGHKPHQGWDLYAPVGTPVHAIGAGRIVGVRNHGSYGLQLLLYLYGAKYHHHDLYAFYAHLSSTFVLPEQDVCEGFIVGNTGVSGNARNCPPHLHFEIRTQPWPGKGLFGRIDPGNVLGFRYYSCAAG